MLKHDPVLADLARHLQEEANSSAQLDWEADRKEELESEYCADGDFYDAIGRVDSAALINALWLALRRGDLKYAKGCVAEIMLAAAEDYALDTVRKELRERAAEAPDLH